MGLNAIQVPQECSCAIGILLRNRPDRTADVRALCQTRCALAHPQSGHPPAAHTILQCEMDLFVCCERNARVEHQQVRRQLPKQDVSELSVDARCMCRGTCTSRRPASTGTAASPTWSASWGSPTSRASWCCCARVPTSAPSGTSAACPGGWPTRQCACDCLCQHAALNPKSSLEQPGCEASDTQHFVRCQHCVLRGCSSDHHAFPDGMTAERHPRRRPRADLAVLRAPASAGADDERDGHEHDAVVHRGSHVPPAGDAVVERAAAARRALHVGQRRTGGDGPGMLSSPDGRSGIL